MSVRCKPQSSREGMLEMETSKVQLPADERESWNRGFDYGYECGRQEEGARLGRRWKLDALFIGPLAAMVGSALGAALTWYFLVKPAIRRGLIS